MYNASRCFCVSKRSAEYRHMLSRCADESYKNYRHPSNESLYLGTIAAENMNYMYAIGHDTVRMKCILFAKQYNVPLLYFPEFATHGVSLAGIIETMRAYLHDTAELLDAINDMDISAALKLALCADIQAQKKGI